MPKREDERTAASREPRGRGLCPFCGSMDVYYNEHYKSWRCGRCERSFPAPSYGPYADGTAQQRKRQRRWVRIAIAILVLLVAVAIVAMLERP